jgi:hypothetical protein
VRRFHGIRPVHDTEKLGLMFDAARASHLQPGDLFIRWKFSGLRENDIVEAQILGETGRSEPARFQITHIFETGVAAYCEKRGPGVDLNLLGRFADSTVTLDERMTVYEIARIYHYMNDRIFFADEPRY